MAQGNRAAVKSFVASLTAAVARQVERILILPLHGRTQRVKTIREAVKLIESYNENTAPPGFKRYEIQIQFSTGNEITGKFNDKASAIEFLQIYQSPAS